jgi:hypothetical protein
MKKAPPMTPFRGLKSDSQRAIGISPRIAWTIYLIVAATMLVTWFVAGSATVSYLFGGWMLFGAILLWLIEDAAKY